MNQVKLNINNFSWLLGTMILKVILSIFISIWIARYLGPTDFGLLNYVISLVALISILSTLGIEHILVKRLIETPENSNILIGSSFLLKLIGSLILVSIAIVFALLKDENTIFIILISFISLSYIFKAFDVIRYWFEAHKLSKESSRIDLYCLFFVSLFKIILILLNAELIWFAFSILLESIILAIGLSIIYVKNNSLFFWKTSISTMKELLVDSWPLILAGVLFTIYTKIDQIMLGDLIDNKAVGIYVAAVTLSQGWLFVPTIIAKAFYPQMLEAKKTSREKYLETTQHLLNIIALLSIMVSIIISIISYYLVYYTFGIDYILSAPILTLHIWGGIFTAMSAISYRYFISENLQKTSFYRGLSGLIINVLLNIILIPLYEGLGASIATVISLAFSLYIFNAFTNNTKEMFLMQTKALLLTKSFYSLKYLINLIKQRNNQ